MPFEFSQLSEYKPARYFARSSLISIYSPSLDIKQEGINLKSQFQQKTVFSDLNKVFRDHIKESKSSLLIIDLIDERFDILKYRDSYMTYSEEYKNSNLPSILNTTTLKRIYSTLNFGKRQH